MKTPLLAVLLALGSAAFASDPLMPIPMGPAGAGQCVVGSEGCGQPRGAAMDPVGEAVIVGLGQRAVPTLGGDAVEKAAKLAAAQLAKTSETTDIAGNATDLVAIGGQIINPGGSQATFRSATGMTLNAAAAAAEGSLGMPKQATFDTRVDGSGLAAAAPAKPSGLSYVHSQKVEAVVGAKIDPFGSDPKLNAGDAGMGAGGTRASSNGSR